MQLQGYILQFMFILERVACNVTSVLMIENRVVLFIQPLLYYIWLICTIIIWTNQNTRCWNLSFSSDKCENVQSPSNAEASSNNKYIRCLKEPAVSNCLLFKFTTVHVLAYNESTDCNLPCAVKASPRTIQPILILWNLKLTQLFHCIIIEAKLFWPVSCGILLILQ